MGFLIYINSVRAILIILSIYYTFKRNFKMLSSTIPVFVLTFLLLFLDKIIHVQPDIFGSFLYVTNIFMAIYLGKGLKFYDKYSWWDRLVHFLSGIIFVSFAVAFTKNIKNLEKLHILFFCLTYSLSHHVLWELLEYISDCIFHTNNQRWQKANAANNHVSQSAIQPAGLVDTMQDTIFCIIGTVTSCIVWWFIL